MSGRIVLLCLCSAWLLVFGLKADVQPSPTPPPAAVLSADNAATFDAAAATKAWLDTVPPEKKEKSDAYFEDTYWLILWDFLVGAAIALFVLFSGLGVRLRDALEKRTRFKAVQVAGFAIGYLIISYALAFPLTVYEQFFREHAYGLATQTFGPWFREQLIAIGVNAVGQAILFIVLYTAFRRAPRTWWVWGTGVAILFLVIAAMIGPVFIAPLFNKYQPLTDARIRDPILALARANEIPVNQVYEFDASRQSNRVSANVSGFLGTTRISLNDNLLKQCSLPEIRYVMSHEMGHYVLNHNQKLVSEFAMGAFIAFFLARFIFDWALGKWGNRWGLRGLSDPAGLPLLMLVFSALGFIGTPINNNVVRMAEREADAFAINASREPDGMAQAALKLGAYRKLNPGELEEILFYDHPSGRARIRMGMDWKAAQLPTGGAARNN